jgi:ATP-dependent Clp protease adaptor protein ClpS
MMSSKRRPASAASTKPEIDEELKSKILPPYNVILMNDDFHSFDFVVGVLRKVFGVPEEQAFLLALRAHETGRSVVWTGAKETAEFKVEQIRTYHEKRAADQKDLGPLDCYIEPAA